MAGFGLDVMGTVVRSGRVVGLQLEDVLTGVRVGRLVSVSREGKDEDWSLILSSWSLAKFMACVRVVG